MGPRQQDPCPRGLPSHLLLGCSSAARPGLHHDPTPIPFPRQVIGLNTPLSQQAGYYCSVCDCVLRDSQSYLDHINGVARAQPRSLRVLPALVARALSRPVPAATAWPRRFCPDGCLRPSARSLTQLPRAPGKYHNRALGMSMTVEKSTVEQVGYRAGRVQGSARASGSNPSAGPLPRRHVAAAPLARPAPHFPVPAVAPVTLVGHPVSLANPRLTHPPLPQVKNRLKLHKESASTSNAEDYLPDGIDRRIAEAEAAAEREREERKRAKKEAKEAKRTAEGEEGGMDPDMMAMMGFGGFGSSKK